MSSSEQKFSGQCFKCKAKREFVATRFEKAANPSTKVAIGQCAECKGQIASMVSNKEKKVDAIEKKDESKSEEKH